MALPWLLALLMVLAISPTALAAEFIMTPRLKEFDNFLRAVQHGEPDEDFDDESYENQWENSGKFEGDILLSGAQHRALLRAVAPGLARNGINDVTRRWADKTVVYSINQNDFSSEQMSAIKDGMDDIARSSCVKFRERNSDDDDFVTIRGDRRGCYSNVGFLGGKQVLNLAPHPPGRGCMRHGTIVHELLHALGFYHMQSHTRRDDYVRILFENIQNGREHNFRIYNALQTTDFGVPYDYNSVLHYSQYAFSKNGKKTIIPKTDSFTTIGQRDGMSESDALKLNLMYRCPGARASGGGGGGEEFEDERPARYRPSRPQLRERFEDDWWPASYLRDTFFRWWGSK